MIDSKVAGFFFGSGLFFLDPAYFSLSLSSFAEGLLPTGPSHLVTIFLIFIYKQTQNLVADVTYRKDLFQ